LYQSTGLEVAEKLWNVLLCQGTAFSRAAKAVENGQFCSAEGTRAAKRSAIEKLFPQPVYSCQAALRLRSMQLLKHGQNMLLMKY